MVTMKLTFFWFEALGRVVPQCHSEPVNEEGFNSSPLANLLVDDGGLGIDHSVSWIAEGIARIDRVADGELPESEWGRETLAADLKPSGAVIYFQYDEDVFEVVDLQTLRRALVAWREFIQAPPDIKVQRVVEV